MNIVFALTYHYGYPDLIQSFRKRRGGLIRALNNAALASQYLRKPVHRAAADTDKVYSIVSFKNIVHKAPSIDSAKLIHTLYYTLRSFYWQPSAKYLIILPIFVSLPEAVRGCRR